LALLPTSQRIILPLIFRAEVRKVRKQLVYIRMGSGSGHGNWLVRVKDRKGIVGATSGPIGNSAIWEKLEAGAGELTGKKGL
jgi:hypothetical protein